MATWNNVSVRTTEGTRPLWLDIIFEIAILTGVYLVYAFSRGSLDAKASVALDHARALMDIEKSLGIFAERDIQSLFLGNSVLTHLANVLYTICYYPSVILFALWAYWRHRPRYKFVRTVFVISAAIAFVSFALYPMAPPRFFDGSPNHAELGAEDLGFVDTIADYWHANESPDQKFYNPFAAMPSLHFGWALMVGIGIWWMTRSRWGRALGLLLPIGMFFGIISTANHFILDAAAGAAVIGIAFGLAAVIYRYQAHLFPIRKSRRAD